MTESALDPRIHPLLLVIAGTCEPRVARDIRSPPLADRGLHAAARARPHAPRRDRRDVARAPASDHARHDTHDRTRTVSRSPRPPPRTSYGTRYIDGACPESAPSASARPRWVTIPPPHPTRSRGGVDHDPAAKWISTMPPLKRARSPRREHRQSAIRSPGFGAEFACLASRFRRRQPRTTFTSRASALGAPRLREQVAGVLNGAPQSSRNRHVTDEIDCLEWAAVIPSAEGAAPHSGRGWRAWQL